MSKTVLFIDGGYLAKVSKSFGMPEDRLSCPLRNPVQAGVVMVVGGEDDAG